MVCSLAAEMMEDEYLAMVERHKDGPVGKRGIDLIAAMFGELVHAMTEQSRDVLGDLFQSAVSHQERGQFFTPESLTQLLGELTVEAPSDSEDRSEITISDPCCGTGRMLLDSAKRHPNAQVHGVDIDERCAKIAAINLGLRQCYGWIICGNSLTLETRFAYRIAPFYHESERGLRRGVIRYVDTRKALLGVDRNDAMRASADLFQESQPAERDQPPEAGPSVIEIPRWLLRAESQPAASGPVDDSVEAVLPEPSPAKNPAPKSQRKLF
jgi:hypothetical protein